MRGVDSMGQAEGTNVDVTKTSEGRTPGRHKIPLGIVIFLQFLSKVFNGLVFKKFASVFKKFVIFDIFLSKCRNIG